MLRAVVSILSILAACDGAATGGDSSVSDAGGADGGGDASMPAAPMPPALPDFEGCPSSWRRLSTGDGFDVCDPFPEGGRDPCDRFEAHFPTGTGCVRIGRPCPVGEFADGLPTDGSVIYVRSGGSGGDGSAGAPFGTVAEATAVASPGSTIALSKGRFEEQVDLPDGVSLVGACPEETTLSFDGSSYSAGVIDVRGAAGTISNLTVAQSERPAIMVVGEGASATVRDVVLYDCAVGGISAEQGAVLDAENISVRDMRPVAVLGALGRALNVELGARATVRRLFAEGNAEHGVLVFGAGSELVLEDATISDTSLPAEMAPVGSGLTAAEGGRLEASRVVVSDATTVGVLVQNEETDATFVDLVVRRTRPGSIVSGARGVETIGGATTRCTRCLVEDVTEFGVSVDRGSALTLTDVLVRRVGARALDDRAGRGVSVQTGSTLSFERLAILDVREGGILAHAAGTEVSGQDLLIRRVVPDLGTGTFGRGITFQLGARGEITRAEIGDVHEGGVTAMESGASAILTDLWLHDVHARTADSRFGRGVSAQVDASLELTRARVERTRDFGVAALGRTSVVLTDVAVVDVTAQECADGVCAEEPGGHGLGCYFSSQLEATRFEVVGAVLCGVQVAEESTVALSEGLVTGSSIGVCLQSGIQDVSQLQDDVRYVDNDSNLEATMLPVPMPFDAVE